MRFRRADAWTIVLLAALAAAAAAWRYGDLRAGARDSHAAALTLGDPNRARAHILAYGCAGCHRIGGIPNATGQVGPPLTGIGSRIYVGGVLPNSPDNLLRFILNPRAVNERSAMPVTGISEQQARDVVAYLLARS